MLDVLRKENTSNTTMMLREGPESKDYYSYHIHQVIKGNPTGNEARSVRYKGKTKRENMN